MDKLTCRVVQTIEEVCGANREPEYDELSIVAERLGAKLDNGATRWALIFKERRLVYKFPRYESTCTDYCELEVKNYELGKQYRIEKCLLAITHVATTASGIPLYVQPMYTTSHNGLKYEQEQAWQRKIGKLHRASIVGKVMRGCYDSPTRFWLERAIQIYGKAFMLSFEKWTREGKVNDLHSANVDYLGKQPIIIDYAGYRE